MMLIVNAGPPDGVEVEVQSWANGYHIQTDRRMIRPDQKFQTFASYISRIYGLDWRFAQL